MALKLCNYITIHYKHNQYITVECLWYKVTIGDCGEEDIILEIQDGRQMDLDMLPLNLNNL